MIVRLVLGIAKFPALIFVLAVTGLPLFVVIALLAMGSYAELGWDLRDMFNDIDELADKGHLLPIPLFTFAGFLLARSKAPERLVRLADALLGSLPGGLAIVSICACTFFTTFTGASGVTIIALGGLLYPVLKQRKYPEQFSLGLLTSAGSLGLLFFPALPVFIFAVVYGFTTESSDVTPEGLFLAGLLPGILLTLVLCAWAWFKGVQYGIERTKFCWKELWDAFRAAIFEALLPVILVGSILSGVATLNEVATLTCVYLIIVEMVIHREIHPTRDLPKLAADAMVLVGAIVLIMAMIMPTKDVLADQEVPQKILAWFGQFIDSRIGFLIALNIFLLVVGCLMDIFSAIVAVLPLLIPLAQEYDVEPLHLGVIFLTNLEIGYLTPPVGINLFISSFQFKKPVLSVYKSVIPFIALMFGTLLIITYVPALSTALPHSYIETTFPSLQEYIDSNQLSYEEEQELSDEEFIRRALGESGEDTEGDLNPDTWSEGDDGDLMPDSPGLEDESGDLMPDDPSIEDESGDLMPDDPSIEDDSGDLMPDNPSIEDESGDLIPD